MITNVDIADAIAELIEGAFPGEPLYRGSTPDGFQRPSNLLKQSGGKIYPNFGCGTAELRPRFTISTFVPVDAQNQSDPEEVCRRQMILAGLFLPGYVRVGNRAPRVLDEAEMENGPDFASLTVTLCYTLSRREFMALHQQPHIGTLHFNQEVNHYG